MPSIARHEAELCSANDATRTSAGHPWRRGNPCAGFDQTMSTDPKQVLILGGGFAGVYTARYLEKLLRAEEASITLINRENY